MAPLTGRRSRQSSISLPIAFLLFLAPHLLSAFLAPIQDCDGGLQLLGADPLPSPAPASRPGSTRPPTPSAAGPTPACTPCCSSPRGSWRHVSAAARRGSSTPCAPPSRSAVPRAKPACSGPWARPWARAWRCTSSPRPRARPACSTPRPRTCRPASPCTRPCSAPPPSWTAQVSCRRRAASSGSRRARCWGGRSPRRWWRRTSRWRRRSRCSAAACSTWRRGCLTVRSGPQEFLYVNVAASAARRC